MRILTFDLFEASKNTGTEPLTKIQQQFLNRYTKGTWTWNPQTGLVDIEGDFDIENRGFKSFKGVNFGRVSGDFNCYYNKLTSLEGAPKEVRGTFDCACNQLTSLEGAPKKMGGDFNCSTNKLTSLSGAPKEVGGSFKCSNNKLTSLVGAPDKVGVDFSCILNELTSLQGAPGEVGANFDCERNKLTSLEGSPEKVGDFNCKNNQLTSLSGAPKEVRGYFNCFSNLLTSLEGAPKEVEGDFNCAWNKLTSLVGAPKKIGGEFKSDTFVLKDWSIAGFLDLLQGNVKTRDPNATIKLILQLHDRIPPEEFYLSITKRPDKNELLSRIRKEHPQLWDRIKGFGGRSSLSADMGDLFF